jgi:hypothetical protein
MQHSAKLRPGKFDSLIHFSKKLQSAIHAQMVEKVGISALLVFLSLTSHRELAIWIAQD